MRECARYYNAQKPGKHWYVKKNPQSQWIAGFLFLVTRTGIEPKKWNEKALGHNDFLKIKHFG